MFYLLGLLAQIRMFCKLLADKRKKEFGPILDVTKIKNFFPSFFSSLKPSCVSLNPKGLLEKKMLALFEVSIINATNLQNILFTLSFAGPSLHGL